MALNSSFGEYITKEYGLLRHILSYLGPSDLRIAKLVCQDWDKAIESLIDKNPVMVVCKEDENNTPFFSVHKPILPTLVLHQSGNRNKAEINLPMHCKCKRHFIRDLCPCSLLGPDTHYISVSANSDSFDFVADLDVDDSQLYTFHKKYVWFVLPTSENIQVSVFSAEPTDSIFQLPITEEIIDKCVGGPQPIKCLLVLMDSSGSSARRRRWINKLLTQVVRRQGLTFAIGGGEVIDIECVRNSCLSKFPMLRWDSCGVVMIALRGDNVTAHSGLLENFCEHKIEEFMEKLAAKVGPLPEGATRMAFVAQCVDRTDVAIEAIESSAFKKYFPSVPLFGMQAYGEFGITRDLNDFYNAGKYKKRRRKTLNFDDARTSSFLILTFKKV